MDLLKVSSSPHIRCKTHTQNIMLDVIIALIPALGWGVYVYGFRVLTITAVSVISAVLFEYLFTRITKRDTTVSDLSAVVTGILIAFNLPVSVPLWLPAIGSLFAIVIVKQIFGGLGKNIVNPAIAARAFLFISFPGKLRAFTAPFEYLSPFKISVPAQSIDAITSATPLAALKTGQVNISEVKDYFFGISAGCIGEISVLCLLIGFAYLLVRKVISINIPVAFVASVFLLSFFFAPGDADSVDFALCEILTGGLMLGAIFMATDYATSPVTKIGKIIFGVGCGGLTVFIRFFGGYPEGVSFAILMMNTLVWFIDSLTTPQPYGGVPNAKK